MDHKELVFIKEQVLRERNVGEVFFEFLSIEEKKKDIYQFAKGLGFSVRKGKLKKLKEEEAFKIFKMLLWKGLAYPSYEIMSEDRALFLLAKMENFLKGRGFDFFTNAVFNLSSKKLESWNSITESTFDVGIFAINEKMVFCFLVKEED